MGKMKKKTGEPKIVRSIYLEVRKWEAIERYAVEYKLKSVTAAVDDILSKALGLKPGEIYGGGSVLFRGKWYEGRTVASLEMDIWELETLAEQDARLAKLATETKKE